MSNYLAIAATTATVCQTLSEAFADVRPELVGAEVRAGRPEANATQQFFGVNVYLFQVVPNAAMRNNDLPTRLPNGTLVERPQAAIDLNYLLTFYGDEGRLEPQRLLGASISALHATPVLTRERIERAISASSAYRSFLTASDLPSQVEAIRLTPITLSLEELSKLWTVFFQVAHALSIAYTASVVLIDADMRPQPAMPVRTMAGRMTTHSRPAASAVANATDASKPILAGQPIRIEGAGLAAATTDVLLGGVPLDVTSFDPSGAWIECSLGGEELRSGPSTLVVRVAGSDANAAVLDSPPIEVIVHPTITRLRITPHHERDGDTSVLHVSVDPPVGQYQSVVVQMNGTGPLSGQSTEIASTDRTSDSASIAVPLVDVPAGTWLVRIVVSGAASLLHPRANHIDGPPDGPKVRVP